MRDAMNFRS